jgi:hypothetical protein
LGCETVSLMAAKPEPLHPDFFDPSIIGRSTALAAIS